MRNRISDEVGQAGERVGRDRMAGEYRVGRGIRQRQSRVELQPCPQNAALRVRTVVLPAAMPGVLYSARASIPAAALLTREGSERGKDRGDRQHEHGHDGSCASPAHAR
jgi:hypothetical protein